MSKSGDTGSSDLEQAIDKATESVSVRMNELDELADASSGESAGLAHLMDVPVHVTVEVGRTEISLGELARVSPGSLLELDSEAHQPADILVNGKIVARGEIVTIGEHYGVRITTVEP
jgi:flagellar motor switch protein FliN/FliY